MIIETSSHKTELGQFFTKNAVWKTKPVMNFLNQTISDGVDIVVDPFAGGGDLLLAVQDLFGIQKGFDIDQLLCESKGWMRNNSLVDPIIIDRKRTICITNPPYHAKNSAKKLDRQSVLKYFENEKLVDLYLIALQNCLKYFDYIIAIIPETFILTDEFTDRLILVDVLEENPFDDTTFPVLVACFGIKDFLDDEINVFKNGLFCGTWAELQNKIPKNNINANIKFNDKHGNLDLIAVDGQSDKIRFAFNEVDSDEIKVSSRARTKIMVDYNDLVALKNECNKILEKLREDTFDLVFASFKSNNKAGIRRRRLDFRIARKIIEKAIENLSN